MSKDFLVLPMYSSASIEIWVETALKDESRSEILWFKVKNVILKLHMPPQ